MSDEDSFTMATEALRDPSKCSLCKNDFSLESNEAHTPVQGLCGVTYCKACILNFQAEQSAKLTKARVNVICPNCNNKCFRADNPSPNLQLVNALKMLNRLRHSTQDKGCTVTASSIEELREWSKNVMQHDVVQHAKVFIEWNRRNQRKSGSVDTLEQLCLEADAYVEDALKLSDGDLLTLAKLLLKDEDESKAIKFLYQRSDMLEKSATTTGNNREKSVKTEDIPMNSEVNYPLQEVSGRVDVALVSPTVSPTNRVVGSGVEQNQDFGGRSEETGATSELPPPPILPVLHEPRDDLQFHVDSPTTTVNTTGTVATVGNMSIEQHGKVPDGKSSATIEKAKAKIIAALAELRIMRIVEVEKDYLAISAGYSCTTTKSFATALKILKDNGSLASSKNGCVHLTAKGIESTPPVDPPANNVEVQERLLGLVLKDRAGMPSPQKALSMFNVLLDGALHSRTALAQAAGFTCTTTKSFMKFLKRLDTLGLLDTKIKKGGLQLNDRVFPFGRPGASAVSLEQHCDLPLPGSLSAEVPNTGKKRKKTTGPAKSQKKKKERNPVLIRNTTTSKRDGQSLEESTRTNVCRSLAEWRSLNIHSPSVQDVAMLAGYTNVGSASFKGAMKILRSEGVIIDAKDKKCVELTQKGLTVVPQVTPPRSNSDMHERILKLVCRKVKDLPRPEKTYAIFYQLSDGKEHTLESLGNPVGYSNVQSVSFKNLRKRLIQFGFLTKCKNKNCVMLTDKAFPYGRPHHESKTWQLPPSLTQPTTQSFAEPGSEQQMVSFPIVSSSATNVIDVGVAFP